MRFLLRPLALICWLLCGLGSAWAGGGGVSALMAANPHQGFYTGYSTNPNHRYGFQGEACPERSRRACPERSRRESDDELYGDGNAIAFTYRVHDVRIGRFLSVDPLAPEYPWNSPYAFSENRVVDAVELEGLEKKIVHQHLGPAYPDGTYPITKTEVQIDPNYQENYTYGGTTYSYARTEVYRYYDGIQIGDPAVTYEEIGPGYPTPSAAYDYSQEPFSHSSRKVQDDLAYINSGSSLIQQLDLIGKGKRLAELLARDINVPDNATNVEGVEVLTLAFPPTKLSRPLKLSVSQVQAKLELYPKVVDPRTGKYIPLPSVTRDVSPVPRTATYRENFIREWHERGYPRPPGGWGDYQIHHIRPLQYGGTDDFWNMVPLKKPDHDRFTYFWRQFGDL